MILLAGVTSVPALADCTTPHGVAGSLDYDPVAKIRYICDGTDWKLLEEVDDDEEGARQRLQIANDPGACTAEKNGRLRYNGTDSWDYCNGSNWIPFSFAAAPRGYFVQSAGQWKGNLGGLSGANAKCYDDLTANDWKYKADAGSLTPERIKAFLCDSTSCNNLRADTTYIMSKSGSAALGGVGFQTDSQGRGFGMQIYVDYNIWTSVSNSWTNRATVNDMLWATTPKGGSHCSNWTSTGGNGHKGNAGSDARYRWDDGTLSCNTANYLICIVDPK
jgi:hypothetical protein